MLESVHSLKVAQRPSESSMSCLTQTYNIASGFRNYTVCTSYDRKYWFRLPTSYSEEAGALNWSHAAPQDQVYFAYFAPFR